MLLEVTYSYFSIPMCFEILLQLNFQYLIFWILLPYAGILHANRWYIKQDDYRKSLVKFCFFKYWTPIEEKNSHNKLCSYSFMQKVTEFPCISKIRNHCDLICKCWNNPLLFGSQAILHLSLQTIWYPHNKLFGLHIFHGIMVINLNGWI